MAKTAAFNVFETASSIKTSKPKVGKGKVKPTFTLPGLDDYAQYKTVATAIEALCVAERETMDPILYTYFAEEGCKIARQPENPDGVGLDNIGLGSLQLRKRSTLSVLSPEEQEFLAENDLPTETIVVTPETFIINPEYLADKALMDKVGKALAGLGIPADFIQRQDEVSKVVVSEDTIAATFKLTPEVARDVLPVVTTLGIRPKVAAGVTLEQAIATTVKGLGGAPDVVNEAMADPSKLNTKNEAAAKRKPRAKKAA